MSAKQVLPLALIGVFLGQVSATAQVVDPLASAPAIGPATTGGPIPPPNQYYSPPPPVIPDESLTPIPGGCLPQGSVVSPWGGCDNGCCGPIGGHGPIGHELYGRAGLNVPIGGGFLDDRVQLGWTFGGGGRTLLFNVDRDAAWTWDMGLFYTYNNGRADNTGFDLFGETVSVRALHRTHVRMTFGREWWLLQPAQMGVLGGGNWRLGGDFGGFLGSSHVDLNVLNDPNDPNGYRRRHDVIGGSIVGLHLIGERHFDGWNMMFGVRAEWLYNRLDLLPGSDGDFHDVNFLLTGGIRF